MGVSRRQSINTSPETENYEQIEKLFGNMITANEK